MSISKLYRVVGALFLLLTLLASTQLNAQDSSLVAWYPFSGNANDSSGSGNDGTVFGATLAQDRFGNTDDAYLFDGINDYIFVDDAETLTPANQKLSISVWFKTTFPGDRFILYKGSNQSDREYAMGVRTDSLASFQINDGGDWQDRAWVLSSKVIEEEVWNHLVGVWDGDSLSIYLNNEKGEVVASDLAIGDFSSGLYIGTYGGTAHHVNNQYAFNGILDDLRIYNAALSDSTIQELYTEGGWPLPQDSTVVPDSGLVGYYPFNGDASDESGFANNGTVFGASLTHDRFGNDHSAYLFDGIDDYIDFGNDSSLDIQGDLSISVWAKGASSTGSVTALVGKSTFESGGFRGMRPYGLGIDDGDRLFPFIRNGDDDIAGVFIDVETDLQQWYHYVFVFKAGEYMNVYRDGVLVNSRVTDVPGAIESSGNPLVAGGRSDTGNPTKGYFFNGSIDDIRLLNYAISDSSIQALYTEGGWPLPEDTTIVPNDTLAGYYPFNGDASDSSGYGNHGNVFGAELTTDRFGRPDLAYYFDGKGSHISVSNPQSFHSNKNLSFSFWAKGASPDTSFAGLITKEGFNPFGVGIDDGDRILFSVYSWDIPLNLVVTDLETDPEEWYHYAVVYRGGDYLKAYRNGVEIGSLYGTIPEYMDVDSSDVIFGSSVQTLEAGGAPPVTFEGSLDEIRFYNYDLTPDEINTIYQNEKLGPIPSEVFDIVPEKYELYQNYPNPFNPATNIRFDLPESGKITLRVYDITGRLVATLVDGTRTAGQHQVFFNASNLASGVYLYELRARNYRSIQKLTLIK